MEFRRSINRAVAGTDRRWHDRADFFVVWLARAAVLAYLAGPDEYARLMRLRPLGDL